MLDDVNLLRRRGRRRRWRLGAAEGAKPATQNHLAKQAEGAERTGAVAEAVAKAVAPVETVATTTHANKISMLERSCATRTPH